MKLMNKKYKSFDNNTISSSSSTTDNSTDINHIKTLLTLLIYIKILIFSIFFLGFNEKINLNNEIFIIITTSIVLCYLDKDIIINKYVDILHNYKVSFDTIYSLNQESNKFLFYGKNTGIFFTNHNSSMLIETQLQNLNYVSSQYFLQDNFCFPPTRLNNIQYKFGRYIKNSQSHVISLDIFDDIFIYSHDLTSLCLYNEHKSSPGVNYRESTNSYSLFYLNCIGKDKEKDKDKPYSHLSLKSFISETLEKSRLNSSYFSKLSSMSIINNFYGIFYLKENQNRLFSITIKFIKHNFYIVEANDITDLMNNVIAYNSNKFHKIILTKVVHEIKTPCIGINYLTSNVDRLLHKKIMNEEENSGFLFYKTKVFKEISDSIIKIYCLSELIQNQITENKIYLSGLDFFEVNNSHILIEDILKWGKSILVSLLEHEDNKFLIVPNLIVESAQQHWIKSDERLLKIIIGHVIINAVKYTNKGEITIGVESVSHFQMNDLKKRLKYKLNDCFFKENYENFICFYIKDTGKGFNEEYLKEINSENYLFNNEDIYKLNFSESGSLNIGLKLVKSICLLLNIGLIIESIQNTQTIIKFYIKSHFNKKSIEGIGNKELLNQLNGGEGMVYKNQIYDFKYESDKDQNENENDENTSKSSRDYFNYVENNEENEGNEGNINESKYNSSVSTKKWSMKRMISHKNDYDMTNQDNSNESESINNLTFRNNTDVKDKIYNNTIDYHKIINKNQSLIQQRQSNEKVYKINSEFLNDMNKKLKSISSEDVILNNNQIKNQETKKTFQISLKNIYSTKTIKSNKSTEDKVEEREESKGNHKENNNENRSSNKSSIYDESDDASHYKNHHKSKEIDYNFKKNNTNNNITDSPSYPFSSHLESNNKRNDFSNFNLDFDISNQNFEENTENYKHFHRFRLRSESINPQLKDRLNEYFKYKILIVDDGSMVRKNLYTIINSIVKENNIPCVIECLTDGLEILTNVIKDYLDGDLPTKLIISDENMNWLNGSTALKILSNLVHFRKLYKMTTVILTALEEEEVLSTIKKEANCNYIFKKPIKKDLLKEIICGIAV